MVVYSFNGGIQGMLSGIYGCSNGKWGYIVVMLVIVVKSCSGGI